MYPQKGEIVDQGSSSPLLPGSSSLSIKGGGESDEWLTMPVSSSSNQLEVPYGINDTIKNLLEEVRARLLIWQQEEKIRAAVVIQKYYRNYKERRKCDI